MSEKLEDFRVSYKNFNPNVFITWMLGKKSVFVIFDRDKNIFAKLYQLKDRWYIYYTKLGYRLSAKSFTEAMDLVEQEVENSWKITER